MYCRSSRHKTHISDLSFSALPPPLFLSVLFKVYYFASILGFTLLLDDCICFAPFMASAISSISCFCLIQSAFLWLIVSMQFGSVIFEYSACCHSGDMISLLARLSCWA